MAEVEHAQSPDDLLPSGAAAALAGVSRDTIKRWESNGIIASKRTPTGHRRYRRGDVEALLTNGVQGRA